MFFVVFSFRITKGNCCVFPATFRFFTPRDLRLQPMHFKISKQCHLSYSHWVGRHLTFHLRNMKKIQTKNFNTLPNAMVSSEEWRFQKHTVIATLFAVVAGYADVVSLVRYQAFASILTGNVIWLGRVSVDPRSDDQHTGGSFA